MASLRSLKVTIKNGWTEITNKNKKANAPQKVEPEKRRLIFWSIVIFLQKSEANLILVLNKILQQTNVQAYIRFIKVGYSQSGAISRLLKKKSNAEELMGEYSTRLIKAAKFVDKKVVWVKKLEQLYKLNVYKMPLMLYLGERKIKLLCWEIKLFTTIKLKTMPQRLISKA